MSNRGPIVWRAGVACALSLALGALVAQTKGLHWATDAGASGDVPPAAAVAAKPAPGGQRQPNLALRKPVAQSSTYRPETGADVCVDGVRSSEFCHTNSEANPWWQVDLEADYVLSQIVIYNRADQWGARERTIRGLVSLDGKDWTVIYAHDGSDFEVLPINAGKRTARYVRLQLAATDYLNLQEVEVYGAPK